MNDTQKTEMESQENCGVCGNSLIYGTQEAERTCTYCGKEFNALIYCPEGHYICDSCHSSKALDIIREVLSSTESSNPIELLEIIMSHPSVPMHGPEHHAMVPAILVTAVKNAGYPVPENALEKAISRGEKVPGGWCGFFGACGTGIGVGIAVSVLTEATPLPGATRARANEATAFTLQGLLDGQPRCCKRASRKALELATEFLEKRLNIRLDITENTQCWYMSRNNECIFEECEYFRKN
ncbi:MAG: hypothetical protein JSU79_11440 [Dehalococcoidales bacterium]|nr:MAG: hypothetical protein JSU79_11440 [Dehalococcoidales bacterium]